MLNAKRNMKKDKRKPLIPQVICPSSKAVIYNDYFKSGDAGRYVSDTEDAAKISWGKNNDGQKNYFF